MQVAVMVAGTLAESLAWWLVAERGHDVWRVMPIVLGAMGVAAIWARPPVSAADVSVGAALAVGLGSGLALYLATRAFVWAVSYWAPFRRDVTQKYSEAATVSLQVSLVLSLLVTVPAEEMFWRGLFQEHLAQGNAAWVAAVLTLLAYVAVNLPSRSLPILAAALVGGALWTALAWWSGGVLASVGSHILWTGAMLAFPPGTGRKAQREVHA